MLTHYGTEIWHHDGKDARFRRINREAHHVTFYSQRAAASAPASWRCRCARASVVYPPVADEFRPLARAGARGRARAATRRRAGRCC